jgi:MFS family permease
MRSIVGTAHERLIARHLVAYLAGSVAQGGPFVVVAVEFARRGRADAYLGGVAMARVLPYLVCSPFAGALLERVDLRRLVTRSAAVRCGLATAMLASLHDSPPWAALALVAMMGAAGTPCYPALMTDLRQSLAAPSRELWARRIVTVESVAFTAGPALAGALVVVDASGRTALTASIGLFAAATVMARRIPRATPSRPASDRGSDRWLASTVLRQPGVRPTVAALLAINVLAGAVASQLGVIARDLSPQNEGFVGWLTTAQGIGAVAAIACGSTVSSPIARRAPTAVTLAACAAVLGLVVAGRPALALLACVVFGAGIVAVEAAGSAVLVDRLPLPVVGTAFGLLDSLLIAAMVVGGIAGPALASIAKPSGSLAALALISALPALTTHRRLRHRPTVLDAGTPLARRAPMLEGAAS